jgi:hypothetical protein
LHVEQFKALTKLKLNEKDEFIFQRYIDTDIWNLNNLEEMASANEELLNREMRLYERRKRRYAARRRSRPDIPADMEGTEDETVFIERIPPQHFYGGGYAVRLSDATVDAGFIVREGERWRVDSHLKETLEDFLRFLRIKRAI